MNMKKWLEKAEKFLFYLLVFTIPLGTRKVLYEWPQPFSPAGKFFNEWESVSFWFTDGLLLLLVLVWILNGGRIRIKDKALALFLFFAGLSISAAQNLGLAFYHWLRLGEMVLFFIYIKERFSFFDFKKIAGVFIASAIFQSFVAIGQAMMQQSLGLWFLGEGPLNPGMLNVAKFISQGTKVLRSYGTLPHPNVLAAFLAVAIFFFLFWYFSKKAVSWRQLLVFMPVYFILLFALFLTFSRGITLIFLFVLALWFFWLFSKDKKRFGLKIFYALIILIITYSLLGTVFYRKAVIDRYWTNFSYKEEAVSFRMFYNGVALRAIVKNPVLGVGIGNFVSRMDEYISREQYAPRDEYYSAPNAKKPLEPWLFQPVHNIFLLTAAETGILGLAMFIWFLLGIFQKSWRRGRLKIKLFDSVLFFIFLAFMFFGLFDHFFLTLQSAKLLFWLILGMLGREKLIKLSKTIKADRLENSCCEV